MTGKAGIIASIDRAVNDIIMAINKINSINPIPELALVNESSEVHDGCFKNSIVLNGCYIACNN